ncbi:signal transducer and activator of transcription 2 isoform X2 [Willisornis vidua]|uniref:Signal transducer and activator of transcription 2 isoform X2 n=1 Tax=Willisornis vidua TaxID=1566151 RepID=A0ABQ9DBQ2_9PASS|nr:signal transducer and activator of transcription 2 isoform X2 [Willisornis vidua]
MAQWQEVQSLANTYLEQVHQLYAGAELPMAVRQCLAAWIEDQNWRQAAEPLSSHARVLFQSLLALLQNCLGSLGSSHEDFMLKHNLRKAHRDLQAEFGENPERFANLVANLLQEERRILRLGQAGEQTLKEQKDSRSGKGSKGANEGPLVVTEELHLITFTLAYAYCGLELELETSTLPFVIISNNNQFSSAWASILWFNMLSSDPKAQQFFSAPPPAPWPHLAEVLSWQFESVVERGLSQDHLFMLAEKLFGSKPSPERTVAWPKFSKDGAAGFSFWAWLDGILGLLQDHLKQLWKDGLILGFLSRKQERKLLKSKRTGTFLIRFSESILGGVTFTWVEHPESGSPTFHSVDPYTAVELASLALPDIIRDYQMMMEENVPENPLQFLYPNTPRDEAFGPYYSQRREGNPMEPEKYLNRRLIRVSSRQANQAWQTEEELVVATENLETLQLQPGGQGTQNLGTLQVTPGNLGTLPPSSPETEDVVGMSPGTLQVTEGQGMLPPELRDLELLDGSQDIQELLQALEPSSGALETLEAAELMPNMLETLDGRPQLGSGLADTSALLDYSDPFLPQPEDSALPAVNSLFASPDFPPLHIDASDFQ